MGDRYEAYEDCLKSFGFKECTAAYTCFKVKDDDTIWTRESCNSGHWEFFVRISDDGARAQGQNPPAPRSINCFSGFDTYVEQTYEELIEKYPEDFHTILKGDPMSVHELTMYLRGVYEGWEWGYGAGLADG